MLANSSFAAGQLSSKYVQAQQQAQTVVKQAKSRLVLGLIEKAQFVSKQELDEAKEIAESVRQDLEQVLVTSGFMTMALLQLARQAGSFVERELCTETLAVSALEMAWRKQLNFEDGLRYFGWGW